MLPIKNELFPVERQICDGHLGVFFLFKFDEWRWKDPSSS